MQLHSKNILTALLLLVGVAALINGEFIISSVIFAGAAIVSNVYRTEPEQIIQAEGKKFDH